MCCEDKSQHKKTQKDLVSWDCFLTFLKFPFHVFELFISDTFSFLYIAN